MKEQIKEILSNEIVSSKYVTKSANEIVKFFEDYQREEIESKKKQDNAMMNKHGHNLDELKEKKSYVFAILSAHFLKSKTISLSNYPKLFPDCFFSQGFIHLVVIDYLQNNGLDFSLNILKNEIRIL